MVGAAVGAVVGEAVGAIVVGEAVGAEEGGGLQKHCLICGKTCRY